MDGGASPQAPPGRIAESPPLKEEFEKTLQTAKKEETPGEVAENEPNAQLQKLDSEKKETESKIPDLAVCPPVQIDPAILAQLQLAGIAQLASTPKSAVTNKEPAGSTVAQSGNQTVVQGRAEPLAQSARLLSGLLSDPEMAQKTGREPVADLPGITKGLQFDGLSDTKLPILNQKAVIQTADASILKLDATQNTNISALVASAFEGGTDKKQAVGQLKLDPTKTVIEFAARADKSTVIMAEPAKAQLNVTSVQSISSEVISQTATVKTAPGTNERIVAKPTTSSNSKLAIPSGSKESSVAIGTVLAESAESSQDEGGNNAERDSKNSDPQIDVPNTQSPVATKEAAPTNPTVSGHQLTTAERQAVVDTLTRKIEELATKSVRNEVRVEMHPPDLGSVVVNIRKDMAGLTATLNASNEPLRQALHASRNDLAGALTDRNVGQVKIEVRGANADTMNLGQQFSQEQSQQQNQQQQTRQAIQNANRLALETKESAEQPAPRRAVTTLLDMEI